MKIKDNCPAAELEKIRLDSGCCTDVDSDAFAKYMDISDPLKGFRAKFQYPKKRELPTETSDGDGDGDEECVYLCGNSLGLKPKKADVYLREQLENWGKQGVFMHFTGWLAAATCDEPGKAITAQLVGAKHEHEVSIMNGLSVNLSLLLMAFYRPDKKRFKVVVDGHAFPSDRYALVSLIEYNGLSAEEALIQVQPREGEDTIRTEDVLKVIEEEGESIAVVCMAGVQYYTGQLFDMETITRAARSKGCKVGWDLAHAIGNVRLQLHKWEVDFATWCTYKYLNSGAGGISGIFLHDRHADDPPKHLLGWWSNNKETRFKMADKVDLAKGADSFRLCNPPPFLAALNMASLEIFQEAGMERILRKQYLLTGYLECLLKTHFSSGSARDLSLKIITPEDPNQRGSQLSLVFSKEVSDVHKKLEKRAIVCDYRHPNVIRIAPAPLYNSFSDVRKFVELLKSIADEKD